MGVIDGHDVARAARRRCRGASRPTGRWSSTSTRSRARASSRPRRAGSRGWRSGTRRSRARSSTASRRPRRRPQAVPVARAEIGRGLAARGAAAEARRPQYTAVFADALVAEAKRDRRVIGITAAMAGGTGLRQLERGAARAVLRRRHRRAGRGPVRRRASRSRARSPSARSTRPSCSAPTTRSSTTSACRSSNVVFAMDRAGPGRRRRPDPSRRLRRLLPALAAEHGRDGAARRGDARATCCARRSPTTRGRSRSATRAGPPRASPLPDARARDPDRHRRGAQRGRAGGAARLRLRGPGRPRRRRAARRARPRADGRRRPLREAARRASCSSALAAEHDLRGHDRGERARRAASARRCSSTSRTRSPTRPPSARG